MMHLRLSLVSANWGFSKRGLPEESLMKKALNHLKQADPVMKAIVDRVGSYKIGYREPVFETLVRSIVYQQLSGKAALTIYSRLAAAVGEEPLTPEGIL